jgi:hypothetical protein
VLVSSHLKVVSFKLIFQAGLLSDSFLGLY